MLEVSPAVMASLTAVGSSPDVLAIVPLREASLEEATGAFGLGAVLAGVHDPAAAGSILASCAAAGGSVVIATTGTTDLFAPKVVRSAARRALPASDRLRGRPGRLRRILDGRPASGS